VKSKELTDYYTNTVEDLKASVGAKEQQLVALRETDRTARNEANMIKGAGIGLGLVRE
jgi:hypothetical protein